MRHLFVSIAAALCLVPLAPVHAARPKAAKPSAARLGSAKDEPEEKATPVRGEPCTDADRALLFGILRAVEPAPTEVRQLAVEDLGLLGDPRALNTLAELAQDPNLRIARAAVKAIGAIKHPRAEEILANIVRHPALPLPLKHDAVEQLPFQNTDSAREFLTQVSKDPAFPNELRDAAGAMIASLAAR